MKDIFPIFEKGKVCIERGTRVQCIKFSWVASSGVSGCRVAVPVPACGKLRTSVCCAWGSGLLLGVSVRRGDSARGLDVLCVGLIFYFVSEVSYSLYGVAL